MVEIDLPPAHPAGMATATGSTPIFYTVPEAAEILRCGSSTLYRAIREDAFPAVKLRTRYVVPAKTIDDLVHHATITGECVDIAKMTAQRRTEREIEQLTR